MRSFPASRAAAVFSTGPATGGGDGGGKGDGGAAYELGATQRDGGCARETFGLGRSRPGRIHPHRAVNLPRVAPRARGNRGVPQSVPPEWRAGRGLEWALQADRKVG